MTIIPETRLIYWKTPFINMKVDEKIILKIIKTALNPEMKLIVLAISMGLYSALEGELPIIHRYDGISGNTQGDKKDNTPAPNAIKIDIFSVISILNVSLYSRKGKEIGDGHPSAPVELLYAGRGMIILNW